MRWFCPNCWSEVQPADRACPACGASLEACDQRGFEVKLLAALRHPEPGTSVRAAGILGWLQSQRAVPELIRVLEESRDPYLLEAAARALGRIRSPAAVSPLRRILISSFLVARIAAAQSLGEIGTPDAIRALEEGSQDTSFRVREAVALALSRVGDQRPEEIGHGR